MSPLIKLRKTTLLILVLATALSACRPLGETATASVIPDTILGDEPWYAVYFTDPDSPEAKAYRGGPDEALAEAIGAARASVELAIYDLDSWHLRDALLDAHRRGVAVRMVIEDDNFDRPEIQALLEAGIPIVLDRRNASMHDKFAVIDRYEVWTGSMNFTISDAYRSDNNLIRLRSTHLAENYLAEFEEMFSAGQFGANSPAGSPYPEFTINDALIETYFSPEDDTAARIIALIEAAQESIRFLAFSFTSDDIAAAMLSATERGVQVAGVFEASQYSSNVGTEFDNLLAAGLDVRLDGNPNQMHHKVIIIDRQIVITGSYNFSKSAETSNDENTLILHSEEIAGLYLDEFERIFAQAQ